MDAAKVLIVDDNVDLAHALELRLRANGYKTLLAHNGISAVALAIDQEPLAILMDLHLANEDGFAVMREIRSHSELSAVPVIVVSADCSSPNQDKVLDAGAQAFLEKPVNHRLLLQMLHDIQMRSKQSGPLVRESISKAASKE